MTQNSSSSVRNVVVIGNGMVGHRFCEKLIEFDVERRFHIVTFCEEPRAAYDRVGGACVAVDFGTSSNFDAVSEDGEYLGGVIAPGVEISMEALTERTAKLPRIDLSEPGAAIGKNTQAAIQSGVVYGFAGLIDGISRRLAAELGGDPTFIATGGLAPAIAPFCETIDEVDDLLTLTGLRLIYEQNR